MGQFFWNNLLSIDRTSTVPVYVQITNAIIKEIRYGRLQPGKRLPGVKKLGGLLGVNKKTIEKVYVELELQEWISIAPKKGSYVSNELPELKYKGFDFLKPTSLKSTTVYPLPNLEVLKPSKYHETNILSFDDGFPDPRLVDHISLARAYRRIFSLKSYRSLLEYADPYGDGMLREVLAGFLNETRGIPCKPENLLITRGSQMGLYLSMLILMRKGQKAIVGNPGYFGADQLLRYCGAHLLEVAVDDQGIVVDEIEKMCNTGNIPRLVYTTPHHHHPTTVTLSASRRLALLELADKYRFAIIEDDYDYDFHYDKSPIMPMSSIDPSGAVIYVGSFSKVLAPSFRVGYLVAPKSFVDQAARLRRIIDHQGDLVLERAFAELLDQGEIQRMLKRSLKTYRQRRDHISLQLVEHFRNSIDFTKPDGGLAIWAKFDPSVNIKKMVNEAYRKKLSIYMKEQYVTNFNALRLGFASLDIDEIEEALHILKETLAS